MLIVVLHVFIPSSWEEKVGGTSWDKNQSGLNSEFQVTQDYLVRPVSKKQKEKEKEKKKKERKRERGKNSETYQKAVLASRSPLEADGMSTGPRGPRPGGLIGMQLL